MTRASSFQTSSGSIERSKMAWKDFWKDAMKNTLKFPPVDEIREIAKEGYIFGFPMVMGYKLMHAYAIDENSPEFKGHFNDFNCEARVYTPDDRAVVTPNSDTPYCMNWLDAAACVLVCCRARSRPGI